MKAPNINLELFIPVLEKLCTLRELQEYYSIDDFADMLEAIEAKRKIEDYYTKQAEGK